MPGSKVCAWRITGLTTIILLFTNCSLFAQKISTHPLSISDSLYLASVPAYDIPAKYLSAEGKDLPPLVDNSAFSCFRPIILQSGWECGQASSIGYCFTYEMNRLRKLPADTETNQYPTNYTLNYYNDGIWEKGVNFCNSFETIYSNGHPSVEDFGMNNESFVHWMSGYEKYYNGMHNRLDGFYAIHIGDEDGINHLKYWLWDHMEASDTGGVACVYLQLLSITTLPPGTPEEGKTVVTHLGNYAGHAVAIVGYNDSIRFDYNNDGQYTNHIDLNGDGKIDLKDREIGAFIGANSFGPDWGNNGFFYMMYKTVAGELHHHGVWNKAAYILDVEPSYEPQLTCKIKLAHNSRNKIRIVAGVSADTADYYPQHTLEFPFLNYNGGNFPMQGDTSYTHSESMELGLDISTLLSYIETGEPAKFFIQVFGKDPLNEGWGKIESLSLIDYASGGVEVPFLYPETEIPKYGMLIFSVEHTLAAPKVEIVSESLPPCLPGSNYSHTLQAAGGALPYAWKLLKDYEVHESQGDYPEINGAELMPGTWNRQYVSQKLDFDFPLYGQLYDTLYIHRNGFLMTSLPEFLFPYYISDMTLLKYFELIAPFINFRMYFRENTSDRVLYIGDQSHASFRWIMTADTNNQQVPADFSMTLFPSGKIQYKFRNPHELMKLSSLTGISSGDGETFQVFNITDTDEPIILELTPYEYPGNMDLSNDGVLTALTDEPGILCEVPVKVTDNNGVSAIKSLQFSDGINCSHHVLSGDDELIEANEIVKLSITLVNTGAQNISKAVLLLKQLSGGAIIYDSTEVTGSIPPGDTLIITHAFILQAPEQPTDGQVFEFVADISSEENLWQYRFNLIAAAPCLQVPDFRIGSPGRPNLAVGNTDTLFVSVLNYGHSKAEDVMVSLGCNDAYVTLLNPEVQIGALGRGQIKETGFYVSIDEDCPEGRQIMFLITVHADPGPEFSFPLTLTAGRTPVLLVDLDPGDFSIPAIITALQSLDVLFEQSVGLPPDLSRFRSVFVMLGHKFTQHILNPVEGAMLAEYLMEGGNLYMEGGMTWYDDPQTPVHPMFHVAPVFIYWHERDTISGCDSAFTSGSLYRYESDISLFSSYLEPEDTSFVILKDIPGDYGCAIAYPGSGYRTIASTVDFGSLKGIGDSLAFINLMKQYLAFFGIEQTSPSVPEVTARHNNDLFIGVNPNPFRQEGVISVYVPYASSLTVTLYEMNGRIVQKVVEDRWYEKGLHTLHLNTGKSGVRPGVYLAVLQAGRESARCKAVIIP